MPQWCQFNLNWAVKTAATQTKPACAGFESVDFLLVRAGGLGFYSREFHSPELQLTPMGNAMPLRKELEVNQSPILSPVSL